MTKRLLVLASLVLLMVSPAAFAANPPSIGAADPAPDHADGTNEFTESREQLRHLRNLARIAALGGSLPAIESEDVGDVAVIVDNGSILIPPKPANPFDLTLPSAVSFVRPMVTSTTSGPGNGNGNGNGNNAGAETQSAASNAFDVAFSAVTLDTSFGTAIDFTAVGVTGNGDDDAALVSDVDGDAFDGFPFLGATYTTAEIFAGTDGHITFGASDTASSARDAGRHIGGPPRISVFFNDLDPSCGGDVHADARSDRVVITWDAVPPFQNTCNPTFATSTVQAVLHSDGTIDLVYSSVGQQFAVVGVAGGREDTGPTNELDYTADLPVEGLGAGAIFEEFSPAIIIQQMDVIALAKEFYQTHPDEFDFLAMFAEDVVDIGGGFAFHLGVHSTTEGLGFFRTNSATTRFDNCSSVGLAAGCELESLLNMNRIGLYWPEEAKLVNPPIRMFRFFCLNQGGQIVPCGATFPTGAPGEDLISLRGRWNGTFNGDFGQFGSYTVGLNSAMSIMGQEAGHRWLAFPAVVDPGRGLNNILLGRANAHWSFFHDVTVQPEKFEDLDGDPRASSVEGNAIVDLGPNPVCTGLGSSLFQTQPNELVDGYSQLDEYFIGVRLPGAVSPFFFVRDPVPLVIFVNRGTSPRDDQLFCGEKIIRELSDITDIGDFIIPSLDSNGTRDPLIGDEQDAGPGITGADNAKCNNARECVDVKTMAFILLVDSGPANHAAAIAQVDGFRDTWEEYGNGPALGGIGARGKVGDSDYIKKFDTSLSPAIH